MEILFTGKILAKQFGAAHISRFIHHETAVGLVVEQRLPQTINHERIQTAQHDGKDNGCYNGTAKFSN